MGTFRSVSSEKKECTAHEKRIGARERARAWVAKEKRLDAQRLNKEKGHGNVLGLSGKKKGSAHSA